MNLITIPDALIVTSQDRSKKDCKAPGGEMDKKDQLRVYLIPAGEAVARNT